jgi:hypothetical protein
MTLSGVVAAGPPEEPGRHGGAVTDSTFDTFADGAVSAVVVARAADGRELGRFPV